MSELPVEGRLGRDAYPEEFARPGVEAFIKNDRRAHLSRATQILVMAEQLTRPGQALAAESDGAEKVSNATPSWYAEEIKLLGVPLVPRLEEYESLTDVRETDLDGDDRERLWRRASEGDPTAAAQLIRESILDPSPIVMAAASIGALALASEEIGNDELLNRREMQLLRNLSSGHDTEAKRVARAFAEAADARVMFVGETEERRAERAAVSQFTTAKFHDHPIADSLSIGVHGTFAHYSQGPMAPGSGFYTFLRTQLAPDLFSCFTHHFRWEGRYNVPAQQNGANELRIWGGTHGSAEGMNVVFAHSHGGNVALNAAASGLHIRRLVLLSTPAQIRPPSEWRTIRENVDRMTRYRTHLDRVILADQLASRLPSLRNTRALSDGLDFPNDIGMIQPSPIGWLKHSKWLREDVWERRRLTDSVRGFIA